MKLTTKALLAVAVSTGVVCAKLSAGPFQTVSVPDPTLIPASAAGESMAPMMTPDGRFVVFSSTAANLATNADGAPLSHYFPAKLNVFLRDRAAGTTTLISGNQAQLNGGNGDSLPADVSTNGQFVAFESSASDLVANDTNNVADIFLRDTVSNITTLISVATNGGAANGVSRSAVMTPDGRYVAFVSTASNLVSGDLNNIPDVFLRDTWSNTTTLISVGAMSTVTPNSGIPYTNTCEAPEITPDGRYVAFYSTATNLVAGVTNRGDIYVRDTFLGTTICASLDAHSLVPTNNSSGITNAFYDHCISADGQFVAFQTQGRQFLSGMVLRFNAGANATDIIDTNGYAPVGLNEEIRTLEMTPDGRFVVYIANVPASGALLPTTGIKVWDSQTAVSTLVSVNVNGTPSTNYICDAPSIDPSGRFVTFISNAPDLVSNAVPPGYHCYIRDLQANTTTLVDVNTGGATGTLLPSAWPRMSADGNTVAFESQDSQLVAGDNNRSPDLFVRDLTSGNVELISAREASLPAPSTAAGFSSLSPWSVSGDGRFVTFSSLAENLVTNDQNNMRDVFVRDLLNGTTRLVSVASNGFGASAASSEPSISADGRFVAFTSYATNIVPATNNWQNIFVADLQTGAITLASQTAAGVQANANCYSPLISGDGQWLLFRSKANNLTTNTGSVGENGFVRDMITSNIYALTTGSFSNAVMTHNGRYVIYSGTISGNSGTWLWSSDTLTRTLVVTNGGGGAVAISEDGKYMSYSLGLTLHLIANGVDTSIGTAASLPRYAPHFGGGLLVFGNGADLLVYDPSQNTSNLVTHAFNSTQSAGGASDFADISSDGRYIVYRSTSSNLVENMQFADTNGAPRLFVYDTKTGTNSILSTGASATSGGNFRSFAPVIAANGHTIVFSSCASDLVGNDFNQGTDVFEFAFLFADVTYSAGGATISWPAAPGQTYHVQYKENVDDSTWQILNGTVNIIGNRGSIIDSSSTSDHRIYRVAAF